MLIPIYKLTLTHFEHLALSRVKHVLCNFEIRYVAPIGLAPSYIETEKADYFDSKYFVNIHGYNDLLVSSIFYKRYLNFNYLLIYQLDAYVFKDELLYWCQKKYSYIGAPWTAAPFFKKKENDYRKFSLSYPKVGNGGLSLRATKIHYFSCIFLGAYYLRKMFRSYNEDWLWTNIIRRINPWYKVAPEVDAKYFSIESNPEESILELGGEMPFGTHAWDKNYDNYWRRFIY